MKAGAKYFVVKPFEESRLVAAVNKAIARWLTRDRAPLEAAMAAPVGATGEPAILHGRWHRAAQQLARGEL